MYNIIFQYISEIKNSSNKLYIKPETNPKLTDLRALHVTETRLRSAVLHTDVR